MEGQGVAVAVVGAAAAFATALLTFVRQGKAEKQSATREQIDQAIRAYDLLSEDLRLHAEAQAKRIAQLEAAIAECSKRHDELARERTRMVVDISRLEDEVARLERELRRSP